jgi:hypothetical protein
MIGVNNLITYLKCIHILPPNKLQVFYAGSAAEVKAYTALYHRLKPRLSRISAAAFLDS